MLDRSTRSQGFDEIQPLRTAYENKHERMAMPVCLPQELFSRSTHSVTCSGPSDAIEVPCLFFENRAKYCLRFANV